MSAFIIQNGDKSFLNLYIKKIIMMYGMVPSSPNLMADIRMDLVLIQSKQPLSSATAQGFRKQAIKSTVSSMRKEDHAFASEIAKIILKHRKVFPNISSVRGSLWDYFPDKKREINILMILAGYEMLDDMHLEQTLDSVFISRYGTKIVNDYGVEKSFAVEMALVWCHGYGEALLGKQLII